MRESYFFLLLILLSLVGTCTAPFVHGETACSAPEHRQFDFWLGTWNLRNAAGRPAGAQG